MQKIGILGGSFNPMHNGHIMLGKAAYEQFELDKIIVMPNKTPYYKAKQKISDGARCDMIHLAISPYKYMEISELELLRGGTTYTIDTMRYLNDAMPFDKFYFIIGGDSLETLYKWKSIDELFTRTAFLCAVRNDIDYEKSEKIISEYKRKYAKVDISILASDNCDISSSDIRKRIESNISVKGLLPASVEEYIKNNKLYK